MENNITDKPDLVEKITNTIKKKRKLLLLIIFIIITILSIIFFFNYYQDNQNEKISEKYIKAGLYLSEDREKSKIIYKEIILSKNKFYSILALNNIIENELEQNSEEILKLFNIIENAKNEKERKNLIKLKKALYLIKISRSKEGNKLLQEIISQNSIWGNIALELSNQ